MDKDKARELALSAAGMWADNDFDIEDVRWRKPTWIKCSDEMPDCNETVLLYLGNGIITYGRWIETETPQTWETVRAHDFETGATHWMRLPEPPEDV